MAIFQIGVSLIEVATANGQRTRLAYDLSEGAQQALTRTLKPNGRHADFFLDQLNFGRPPVPWAIVCLDREYQLAGHVASSRPPAAGIAFTPYRQPPVSIPADFYPGVGAIVLASRVGLESARTLSPLFAAAWAELLNCDANRHWLLLLDPPSESWLEQVLPGDAERWQQRAR